MNVSEISGIFLPSYYLIIYCGDTTGTYLLIITTLMYCSVIAATLQTSSREADSTLAFQKRGMSVCVAFTHSCPAVSVTVCVCPEGGGCTPCLSHFTSSGSSCLGQRSKSLGVVLAMNPATLC